MEWHTYNRIAAYEDMIARMQGQAPEFLRPSEDTSEGRETKSAGSEGVFLEFP